MGRAGGRALPTTDWVDAVTNSIYWFLRRGDWARAFDHNGFSLGQQQVSQRVMKGHGLENLLVSQGGAPSMADLGRLWPRGSRLTVEHCNLVRRRRLILRIRTTAALRARRAAGAAAASSSTAAPP